MIVKDILRALALVVVIEGVLPFATPARFRQSLLQIASLDDRSLRIVGITSMIVGLMALQAVHWLL